MPADRRPSRPCAQCGAALQHVPRQPRQPRQTGERSPRSSPAAAGYRRYRCAGPSCDWEGWLPRRSRETVGAILRRKRAAARQRWLLPVLTTLSVTAGVSALGVVAFKVLLSPVPPVVLRQAWVPGEHDDGKVLPAAHPLRRYVVLQLAAERAPDQLLDDVVIAAVVASSAPTSEAAPAGTAPITAGGLKDSLSYRHGCVWGQPGRNPYRGTLEQALKAAVLPAEVVQKISQQVRLGSATDRVTISNAGIRAASNGRQFDASHFAMTYGMTLCTSTRVNFEPGHTEQASLYEASDEKGRVYAVMVPDVCGNVSVLADAEDRRRVTAVAGSSDDAEPEPEPNAGKRAEQADAPETGRAAGGPGVPGFVPGPAESEAGGRQTVGRALSAGLAPTALGAAALVGYAPAAGQATESGGSAMAGVSAASAASAAGDTLVVANTPRRLPPELDWKEPTGTTPGKSDGPREVNTVPEPGSLACVSLALGLMAGLQRRRKAQR